jgi:hypothetical protein
MTPERKAQVDKRIDRDLWILANEGRMIGMNEALMVLKLADTKQVAQAILERRIRELKDLDTPIEPVYLGDVDDETDQDT